jgi:hypothetical protein
VRAYSRPGCCLPTSATALTTYGQLNPSSRFLAGTMAMTTFLFLRITHDPLELAFAKLKGGDARRAALRPNDRDPGAGSSRLRRFSRPRYLDRRATLIETSLVTIDVHGSLDRAKDVSSSVRALFRRHHEECVRLAHADDVPLLILPEDTCCRRCDRLHGTSPAQASRTDQDPRFSDNPRRRSVSRGSGCLPPLRPRGRERIAPLRFPCRPPAHAAHTLPPWLGTVCC